MKQCTKWKKFWYFLFKIGGDFNKGKKYKITITSHAVQRYKQRLASYDIQNLSIKTIKKTIANRIEYLHKNFLLVPIGVDSFGDRYRYKDEIYILKFHKSLIKNRTKITVVSCWKKS